MSFEIYFLHEKEKFKNNLKHGVFGTINDVEPVSP